MREFFSTHRKAKILALAVVVIAIVTAGAFAYLSTHGNSAAASGGNLGNTANCTGTTTTPAAGQCSVNVTTFDATSLIPGGSSNVVFTIKQAGNTSGSSITRTFVLSNPQYTVSSTDSGCQALITANPTMFTESALTWLHDGTGATFSGTGPNRLTTPINTTNGVDGSFSLNYADLVSVDQSACAGKPLSIAFSL